jgi:elongation factor P
MDTETYDQIMLDEGTVGDLKLYIKEGDTLDILTYESEPIDIELPLSVNLKVQYTEPGHKGDTATGGTKPATMETGLVVSVPLFITSDDTLKIDTRTGEYLERV